MNTIEQYPSHTRIWIYGSAKPFSQMPVPVDKIEKHLSDFVKHWTSHSNQLHGFGQLWFDHLLVFGVDEKQAQASGCSIDKKVDFVKKLGTALETDFFDRMVFFTSDDGEKLKVFHANEFAEAYQQGALKDETLVVDSLIDTVGKVDTGLFKPLKDSWHARFV